MNDECSNRLPDPVRWPSRDGYPTLLWSARASQLGCDTRNATVFSHSTMNQLDRHIWRLLTWSSIAITCPFPSINAHKSCSVTDGLPHRWWIGVAPRYPCKSQPNLNIRVILRTRSRISTDWLCSASKSWAMENVSEGLQLNRCNAVEFCCNNETQD